MITNFKIYENINNIDIGDIFLYDNWNRIYVITSFLKTGKILVTIINKNNIKDKNTLITSLDMFENLYKIEDYFKEEPNLILDIAKLLTNICLNRNYGKRYTTYLEYKILTTWFNKLSDPKLKKLEMQFEIDKYNL